MTASLIDGKAIAAALREDIAAQVSQMSRKPGLAVILVGEDPASKVYVGSKIKACAKAGIESFETRLPEDATAEQVAQAIKQYNNDPNVDGILMQLPLPRHLNADELIQLIDPRKDVDGLTVQSIGALVSGLPGLVACTPQGSMKLLHSVRQDLKGLHAIVIGRSLLFGKPMGQLLLNADCTLTQAHRHTQNLDQLCAQADIVVVAVGKPKMVKAEWVKDGAIVIDVGINRLEDGTLCGDVDFDAVKDKASAITPVPGGVGPMTIACLLNNTLIAAKTTN